LLQVIPKSYFQFVESMEQVRQHEPPRRGLPTICRHQSSAYHRYKTKPQEHETHPKLARRRRVFATPTKGHPNHGNEWRNGKDEERIERLKPGGRNHSAVFQARDPLKPLPERAICRLFCEQVEAGACLLKRRQENGVTCK
jgi:hypothetical protein